MTFGITAGQALMAGSAILGGVIASGGAQDAAQTQADAANRAAQLQKEQFDKQMELQDPFRQAGLTGQNRLMEMLGLGGNTGAAGYGKYAKDFSMADYQADPGYAFRLKAGTDALGHRAAARGGLISGGTLKGMQDYAQESASQEYQGAFNRYQTNRANQLQPLGSLMSSGQAAASNQAGQAGQYGVNAGNLMTQAGQSIAAGQMGAANSLAGGLGTAASAYQQQQNFNNYLARQSRVPPAYTGGYTSDAVYGPYEG
jgi:hypothetical protein